MIDFTAKPERTYGLVVGIEKYQGGCRDVDGQANDALEFAHWHRSKYIYVGANGRSPLQSH